MKVDKTKPLIEMSEAERRAAFDELGMAGNFRMLEDGRHGLGQDVILVLARLKSGDSEWTVYSSLEYGDNDGIESVDSLIEEVERVGLLLPGESLRREVVRISATTIRQLAKLPQ